jgi:hypothetical protein
VVGGFQWGGLLADGLADVFLLSVWVSFFPFVYWLDVWALGGGVGLVVRSSVRLIGGVVALHG